MHALVWAGLRWSAAKLEMARQATAKQKNLTKRLKTFKMPSLAPQKKLSTWQVEQSQQMQCIGGVKLLRKLLDHAAKRLRRKTPTDESAEIVKTKQQNEPGKELEGETQAKLAVFRDSWEDQDLSRGPDSAQPFPTHS